MKNFVSIWRFIAATIMFLAFFQAEGQAFTLNVVDADRNPVEGFRWLVEEDTTNVTVPGARVSDSISMSIHKSYAPVVTKGHSAISSAVIDVPAAKRYFVSVLPDADLTTNEPRYTMSGTSVAPGQSAVTVVVNSLPIPTAQISVFVFMDHNPINNAPDTPDEIGLANFGVIISDIAGHQTLDAFGNPLGTTYNPDGSVNVMGDGVITTDANGNALVKYLAPGKYGVRIVPPHTETWIQTSTIEGTLTIDAWVKANEPQLFIEGFGAGFTHVSFGFVNPSLLPGLPGGGTCTITGQNVFNHFSRPPTTQGFFPGPPVSECWVGLNDIVAKQGLIAVACDADSNFSIPNVPPGTYQLVTWDRPLDALFGFNTVTVPADCNGDLDLGQVLSFRWFGTFEGSVFYDANQNGFRDAGEVGIPEQNINIRFRDGSVYQSQPTDVNGEYSFSEVFPFFKWLVTEVDFARFKATGMTAIVDYGGEVYSTPTNDTTGWDPRAVGTLHPQPQFNRRGLPKINPNTGNNLSRTETGTVLTQAMHLFLNQTNIIDWGKVAYASGENGGISGIVFYSVTRAENDPSYGAGEPWEPGIPRVQVNLYRDTDEDGIIDDRNGNGRVDRADVDNHPFQWSNGGAKGPEDIDRNGNGVFNRGDAIDIVYTDSWDDSMPSRCVQDLPIVHGQPINECADNFGTWNQIRPGIFDGGYAFGPNLPVGIYIVEAVPPPGYEIVKEEDKNVDFGEIYEPSPLLLPPLCVGTTANGNPEHVVPAELSLYPGVPIDNAGAITPLCNMKQIAVFNNQNAAADFFFFTEVPKASRVVGFVNNDLTAEFNAGSPIFGEKAAPAWIPISFRDYKGNEITRVYSDEFGSYNAMLPSTFTMNIGAPSGVSPNMITIVLNDPYLPDGTKDPYYDPSFSVTPWTFQFMPGTTTYTDTPLVPVAAFASAPKKVDTEPEAGTPGIASVVGSQSGGGSIVCAADETITITSLGTTLVPNPDYDPSKRRSRAYITRNYGFGNQTGTVTVGGVELTITSWSPSTITATVPSGVSTGTLVVTKANGKSSEIGVTLHVYADCTGVGLLYVSPPVSQGQTPIQDAIDAAAAGDIILVNSGVYNENIILYKPVTLQGSGIATVINANPNPAERLAAWHEKVLSLLGDDPFRANEAPGIMVLGNVAGFPFEQASFIDGFTISGALQGGGIYVNSDVDGLTIRNNTVTGNQGIYGGGITLGIPDTGLSANNTNITITQNRIVKNGGLIGGGGISIFTGSNNYSVTNNYISGNFTRWNGGGIAHYGLSDNGLIANNKITFNEVFFGGLLGGDGGGIFIGGEAAPGVLTEGAGNVTIDSNLIQGNLAGSASGGGVRALYMNGQDISASPADPNAWYALNFYNNMIVNNVAAFAGGGISLQDAAKVSIINNTIANNDSTATAAAAFVPPSTNSTPQGAGIVSNVHSALLTGEFGVGLEQTYSNPLLVNNIIWQNRSFFNDVSLNGGAGGLKPNDTMPYWDLQVAGTTGVLNPDYCVLSSLAPGDGNNYDDGTNNALTPRFVKEYFNNLLSATVIDEGGNAISVTFNPLIASAGDYHILPSIATIDAGTDAYLDEINNRDYDGDSRDNDPDTRPDRIGVDIGADEYIFTTVELINPIGGEVIASGSTYTIQWGAPDEAVRFRLFYSLNNGASWREIDRTVEKTDLWYDWSVPTPIGNKTRCLVLVIGYNISGGRVGVSRSASTFTIEVIKLTYPNGGETLTSGNPETITWTLNSTARPVTEAKLKYSLNGGRTWNLIDVLDAVEVAAGSYNWTVPTVSGTRQRSRVRIILRDSTGVLGSDASNNFFTIQP